jgi:hypothetical protein
MRGAKDLGRGWDFGAAEGPGGRRELAMGSAVVRPERDVPIFSRKIVLFSCRIHGGNYSLMRVGCKCGLYSFVICSNVIMVFLKS